MTGPPTSSRPSPRKLTAEDALRAGLKALQQGHRDQARRIFSEVRRKAPQVADAWHLEGRLKLEEGLPEEALRLFREALARDPRSALFKSSEGEALALLNDDKAALDAFAEAEHFNPHFPGMYAKRASLNEKRGDIEKARADLERHIDGARTPDAYRRFAVFLVRQGAAEDAIALLEDGIARFPEALRLKAILADASERSGELERAIGTAEEVLHEDPQQPVALKALGAAMRRRGEAEAAYRRLSTIRLDTIAGPGRRALHHELGLICDRLDRTDEAFHHFDAQNRLTRETLDGSAVDPAAFRQLVQDLEAAFTDDFVRRWTGAPPASPPPDAPAHAFLVGFPRSGTTLLDQVLDAHPAITVIEERPLLTPLHDAVAARPGGYPEALAELEEATIAALREGYEEAVAALTDKAQADTSAFIVNKMPLNIVHMGLIHRLFPEAKVILALRHPCDAVLSCFMQDFQPNNAMANFLTLEDGAALYDAVFRLWARYERVLPLDVHRVKYEDVVGDLETEARRTLSFLGLEFDDAVLDPAAHARERRLRTPSYDQVVQPIYRSAKDRWRRYQPYLEPVMPVLKAHIEALTYA